MNGREEGGQYYISHTRQQERFAARKVVFSWECLNIFATGCSVERIQSRVIPKAKNEVGNRPSHDATLTADLHVPKLMILQSRFPM